MALATPILRAPAFPPNRIEAACIDLDGTLLDTIPDLAAAANAMLVDIGLAPLPEARIRTFVGKGAEVLVRRALDAATACAAGGGEAGGDEAGGDEAGGDEAAGAASAAGARSPALDDARVSERYELARARFYANYRLLNGRHSIAYDGVREGLAALAREGLALACVTNKPIEFVAPLLQHCGMLDAFAFCIGGDSLPTKKPDPGQLLEACRRFGLAPGAVAAVGDSVNDALAARAAGMPIVLVPYGYNEGVSVDGLDSDGIVASLLEFARAIEGHHARLRRAP